MSEAHRRKKHPEQVRRQLLTAMASLVSERGADAITLDAVARRAGVSKGGLLHHFPSRTALLDALFEELWKRFHSRYERGVESDPEPVGRAARAYLHTCDPAWEAEDDEQLWNLVGVVMLGVSEFRERWVERSRAEMPYDDGVDLEEQARMMICRLAADGLWLNTVLGLYAMPPELRAAVMRQLADSTRPRSDRT